ncbi:hypothetical protein J4032_28910 [Streptomyces formicae]|uniref:Uncharacterized protein n=1 Tax=Streptomyces formicae TaxID=1616117 RepID=A0ABY3WTR0_9ACTN|nr:hypothetical protein [Streptomyces formicae]UNM14951.1 hypothetical protein J4032_28910 [Streptomyces formicae]
MGVARHRTTAGTGYPSRPHLSPQPPCSRGRHRRDRNAVIAGLTLPWNSGVLEGHVVMGEQAERTHFQERATVPA